MHYFISYASKKESLGAVVVEADSEAEAVEKAEHLGLQPDQSKLDERAIAVAWEVRDMESEENQALLNNYMTSKELIEKYDMRTVDDQLSKIVGEILAKKGLTVDDLDKDTKEQILKVMTEFIENNAMTFRHRNA